MSCQYRDINQNEWGTVGGIEWAEMKKFKYKGLCTIASLHVEMYISSSKIIWMEWLENLIYWLESNCGHVWSKNIHSFFISSVCLCAGKTRAEWRWRGRWRWWFCEKQSAFVSISLARWLAGWQAVCQFGSSPVSLLAFHKLFTFLPLLTSSFTHTTQHLIHSRPLQLRKKPVWVLTVHRSLLSIFFLISSHMMIDQNLLGSEEHGTSLYTHTLKESFLSLCFLEACFISVFITTKSSQTSCASRPGSVNR